MRMTRSSRSIVIGVNDGRDANNGADVLIAIEKPSPCSLRRVEICPHDRRKTLSYSVHERSRDPWVGSVQSLAEPIDSYRHRHEREHAESADGYREM